MCHVHLWYYALDIAIMLLIWWYLFWYFNSVFMDCSEYISSHRVSSPIPALTEKITQSTEAATRGALCKNVFWEISHDSQENTCLRVSFLIYTVLKLSKKVHIFQFCADLSKKPRFVKAVYILYASENSHSTLSENDIVYRGLSHRSWDIGN